MSCNQLIAGRPDREQELYKHLTVRVEISMRPKPPGISSQKDQKNK